MPVGIVVKYAGFTLPDHFSTGDHAARVVAKPVTINHEAWASDWAHQPVVDGSSRCAVAPTRSR